MGKQIAQSFTQWVTRWNANPIAWAELRHQWYVIERSRSGRVWIALALLMLIPALLASLVYFVIGLLRLPLPIPIDQIDTPGELLAVTGSVALVTMNVAQYLVVMMVSFGLATNSITREKRGNTWDTLLLTNVSARQIVAGKLWASLQALYGDHLVVGLLRLGLLAYLLRLAQPFQFDGFEVMPGQLLALAGLVLAFTAVDTVMNVTLALLVALLALPGAIALPVFAVLRLAATLYGLWWIVSISNVLAAERGGIAYAILGVAGVLFYALLTFMACHMATWAAVVGSNATPPAVRAQASRQ